MNDAYAVAAAHLPGGAETLDHVLMALFAALAFAACGGAAYCFWQSAARIVVVVALGALTLACGHASVTAIDRRYPDALANIKFA